MRRLAPAVNDTPGPRPLGPGPRPYRVSDTKGVHWHRGTLGARRAARRTRPWESSGRWSRGDRAESRSCRPRPTCAVQPYRSSKHLCTAQPLRRVEARVEARAERIRVGRVETVRPSRPRGAVPFRPKSRARGARLVAALVASQTSVWPSSAEKSRECSVVVARPSPRLAWPETVGAEKSSRAESDRSPRAKCTRPPGYHRGIQ